MPGTVELEIEGSTVSFPKLLVADCLQITVAAYTAMVDAIKKSEMKAEAKAERMERLFDAKDSPQLLLDHVLTLSGANEVLNKSMSYMNSDKPTAQAIASLALNDMRKLAMRLCGFIPKTDEELKKDEDDNMGFKDDTARPTSGGSGLPKPA